MISRSIITKLSESRAKDMVNRVEHFINPNERILDIGAGTCHISKYLLDKNYQVTALDVSNQSLVNDVTPVIYDGKNFPFENDSFDISLILTVLHHTNHPRTIIEEAKRVSKRIVIMEDLYVNTIHKFITYFIDSLTNLEFNNHPHNNLTDNGWKKVFNEFELTIKEIQYRRSLLVLWQGTYLLEK